MARFHISILRPPGYPHSSAFTEVAEGLAYTLQSLGHQVSSLENHLEPGATTILFGAHLLSRELLHTLPPGLIVYNLEQLSSYTVPEWYLQLATVARVWDYSRRNLAVWQSVPCVVPPQLVEIGFVPELSRISSAATQDIDLLFYGGPTTRRERVLDAIVAEGVRVHRVFGVYGPERDALIARSRLVLNLHAEDSMDLFEAARISYLLANRKAVVSEVGADMDLYAGAVATSSYGDLVATCRRLLNDEPERRALEARGLQLFSQRRQRDLLADALRALGTA